MFRMNFVVVLAAALLLSPIALGRRIIVDAVEGNTSSTKTSHINAMQWSAHWRCFNQPCLPKWCPAHFGDTCRPAVEKLLEKFLTTYSLDFVNLGMFQDPDWTPPAAYGSVDWKCSTDNIKFLYDKTKWKVSDKQTLPVAGETSDVAEVADPNVENVFGCGNVNTRGQPDRVYGVMAFQRVSAPEDKVIVVAGHFPHPPGGTSSAESSVAAATGPLLTKHMGAKVKHLKQGEWANAKIVLIADLNNDLPGMQRVPFDSAENINGAFAMMDDRTVDLVKNMKKQIRHANDVVPDMTVGDALATGNLGWVTQPTMSNEDVFAALQVGDLGSATEAFGTCCADKPALVTGEVAFPYAFDRIMASFGPMQTHKPVQELLKASPGQAVELRKLLFVGAFHMPIVGKIEYTSR